MSFVPITRRLLGARSGRGRRETRQEYARCCEVSQETEAQGVQRFPPETQTGQGFAETARNALVMRRPRVQIPPPAPTGSLRSLLSAPAFQRRPASISGERVSWVLIVEPRSGTCNDETRRSQISHARVGTPTMCTSYRYRDENSPSCGLPKGDPDTPTESLRRRSAWRKCTAGSSQRARSTTKRGARAGCTSGGYT